MKKMSLRAQVRQRIDALNGAEFSYKLVSDIQYGSVALSQLRISGELEIVRMHTDPGARPYRIFKATGKPAPELKRAATYRKEVDISELLPCGRHISEYPKGSVTVHRIR